MLTTYNKMIRVRFEPTTHGLEDRCSIQLSYQTVSFAYSCARTVTIIEKNLSNCNQKLRFCLINFKARLMLAKKRL